MENDKINNEEPHIHIFGSEMNKEEVKSSPQQKDYRYEKIKVRNYYHHHGGGSSLGLFLLFTGIILLFNYSNIIPWDFWKYVIPFWPVVLVLAGIRIMIGRNWVSNFVVFFLSLIIFLYIIIYGLYKVHSPLVKNLPAETVNSINNFNQYKQ